MKLIVLLLSLITGSTCAADGALDALLLKYSQKPAAKPAVTAPAKARAPASSTLAEPLTAKAEPEPQEEKEETLLGDWGGVKSWLGKHGVSIETVYKGEVVSNVGGGLKRGAYYLGNIDLVVESDFEKMFGAKGWSLTLYGLGDHGGDPTELVGDAMATSNIESPDTFKLYEAYVKKVIDDRFSMLVGLRDLNADFYSTESSSKLLNSAFGISAALAQTGENGPSIFPTTALAFTVKYESPTGFYMQAGAFNATAGVPGKPHGTQITTSTQNGYLLITQLGHQGENGTYSFGAWTYNRDQAALDPSKESADNSGLYVMLDKPVSKQISIFARHGMQPGEINAFSSGTEVGMKYLGAIPGRGDDRVSVGLARASASEDYQRMNDSTDGETAIELNYRAELGGGVAITPDYQYVLNPGLARGVPDAQVAGLRFEFSF